MKPLVIVPTYLTDEGDVAITRTALQSVRDTQRGVDMLVVDDGSPEPRLVDLLERSSEKLEFDVHRKEENSGFAKTVNVGLQRALDEGRDAVLLNADMQITSHDWIQRFRATTDSQDRPAAVVGALLSYPDGTIQHAGVYFSLLTRGFDHRFKHGPQNLPEALQKAVCPVTAAFQFIRHSTLETVGIYDPGFHMAYEDVDYCIRVFLDGQQCVYNPNIRGIHHEMKFRGRPSPKLADWHAKSLYYLIVKHQKVSFAEFVPNW